MALRLPTFSILSSNDRTLEMLSYRANPQIAHDHIIKFIEDQSTSLEDYITHSYVRILSQETVLTEVRIHQIIELLATIGKKYQRRLKGDEEPRIMHGDIRSAIRKRLMLDQHKMRKRQEDG